MRQVEKYTKSKIENTENKKKNTRIKNLNEISKQFAAKLKIRVLKLQIQTAWGSTYAP